MPKHLESDSDTSVTMVHNYFVLIGYQEKETCSGGGPATYGGNPQMAGPLPTKGILSRVVFLHMISHLSILCTIV